MSQPIFVGDPGDMVQVENSKVAVPRSMALRMMKEFSLSETFPFVDRETPLRLVSRLRNERHRSIDLETVMAFVEEYGRLDNTSKMALLSEAHKDQVNLRASRAHVTTPVRPFLQVHNPVPNLPELPPSSFDIFNTAEDVNFLQPSASDDVVQTPEDFYYDNDPIFHPIANFDLGQAVSENPAGNLHFQTAVKTNQPAPYNAFIQTPLGNKPPPTNTPHRDRLTGIEFKTQQQKGWAPYRKNDRGRASQVQAFSSDEDDLPDLDRLSSSPPERQPVTPVFSPTYPDPVTSQHVYGGPLIEIEQPHQPAHARVAHFGRQPVTYGATVNGICLVYRPTNPAAPIQPPALNRWKSGTAPPIYEPDNTFYNAFQLQRDGQTIAQFTDPQEAAYTMKEQNVMYKDIRAILRMDVEGSGCFVKEPALRARISKRSHLLSKGGIGF